MNPSPTQASYGPFLNQPQAAGPSKLVEGPSLARDLAALQVALEQAEKHVEQLASRLEPVCLPRVPSTVGGALPPLSRSVIGAAIVEYVHRIERLVDVVMELSARLEV